MHNTIQNVRFNSLFGRQSALPLSLALCGLASTSSAQAADYYMDIGPPLSPLAATTYKAAAPNAGVWNRVDGAVSPAGGTALVNRVGATPQPVNMFLYMGPHGQYWTPDVATATPHQELVDDGQATQYATWAITGLPHGRYKAFFYSHAPAGVIATTAFALFDDMANPVMVNAGAWPVPPGHQFGSTFISKDVTVGNAKGSIAWRQAGLQGSTGYLNGVQLVKYPTALGGFLEFWDGYTTTDQIVEIAGWRPTAIPPAPDWHLSSANSYSAPNSLEMSGTGNMLMPDLDIAGGQHKMSTRVFIPGPASAWLSSDVANVTLFNTHQIGGPENISAQVHFHPAASQWTIDAGSAGTASGPLVFDQWVEISAEINLDTDQAEFFYEGQSMAPAYSWTGGSLGLGGGAPSISAFQLEMIVGNSTNSVFVDDIRIEEVDSVGTNYCGPAVPNSTGVGAEIQAHGTSDLSSNNLTLVATGLPPNSICMFLTARNQGFVANPGGSQGNLCVSGPIGRFTAPGQIQSSGAAGEVVLQIDSSAVPTPSGLVQVQPGETWNFQAWYRDQNPGPTSNFTDGIAILFQ